MLKKKKNDENTINGILTREGEHVEGVTEPNEIHNRLSLKKNDLDVDSLTSSSLLAPMKSQNFKTP
jgi:hypothetical protein